MASIYKSLLLELKKGEPLALATIVAIKGSSPQIPGASAIFSRKGLLAGTVGGGLLEATAHRMALQAIPEKISLLTSISMTGEEVLSEEEAICGGEATVLIDTGTEHQLDTFKALEESLDQRKPGVLVTSIQGLDDDRVKVSRRWIKKSQIHGEDKEEFNQRFYASLKESFRTGTPQLLRSEEKAAGQTGKIDLLFLEPLFPPSHLVIAGAGHIGQALAHLGVLLDFDVSVIDDRVEWANTENLPEVNEIIVDDIGKTLRNFTLSEDSYVVIVTRGHRNDAEALRACIASGAGYIGMIGSAHKIRIMREKFLETGWATAFQWDRIHAPVGLEIQSKTVQEIAISIAAELVLIRNTTQSQPKEQR